MSSCGAPFSGIFFVNGIPTFHILCYSVPLFQKENNPELLWWFFPFTTYPTLAEILDWRSKQQMTRSMCLWSVAPVPLRDKKRTVDYNKKIKNRRFQWGGGHYERIKIGKKGRVKPVAFGSRSSKEVESRSLHREAKRVMACSTDRTAWNIMLISPQSGARWCCHMYNIYDSF